MTNLIAERPKLAFKQDNEVDELIKAQGTLFIRLGGKLKEIRDNKVYELLDYDSFNSYLASKGMPVSTGYAYIHIYETYILKFGYKDEDISQVPWYKLQLISSKIKDKDKGIADEWLEKARELSPQDLRTELQEESANEGFTDKKSFPQIHRCKTCGNWRIPKELEVCKCP